MADAVETKEPPVITDESIAAKVAKGESLSEAENEFVKGNPNFEKSSEKEEGEEEPKEEKKEEPKAKKEEPLKKEEPAAAPKPQTPEELQALIETELTKPEGQEDLSKFPEAAIGQYIELKKQRAKNQRLQEENDSLRFEKTKITLEKKAEEEEDPLAKVDDEDIITGKELKRILAKRATTKEADSQAPVITPQIVAAHEIQAAANLKAKGLDDYQEVSQWVQFALHDDQEAAMVIQAAAKKGQNVAEAAYWLVKGSRKWPQIKAVLAVEKAKVKPGDKAKEPAPEIVARAEKLKANETKVKTTGAGGGSEEGAGEYTADDIRAMSTEEFRLLPRETRDKILKKWGSEPNLNR